MRLIEDAILRSGDTYPITYPRAEMTSYNGNAIDWLVSSESPKETKSVSLTGGAGAEGERVALRGTGMGERALGATERVGAVEPDKRALRD